MSRPPPRRRTIRNRRARFGFFFDRLGVRVPADRDLRLYARPNTVVNRPMHHAALVRTLCTKYGLAHLTERDRNAPDLSDAITWSPRAVDLAGHRAASRICRRGRGKSTVRRGLVAPAERPRPAHRGWRWRTFSAASQRRRNPDDDRCCLHAAVADCERCVQAKNKCARIACAGRGRRRAQNGLRSSERPRQPHSRTVGFRVVGEAAEDLRPQRNVFAREHIDRCSGIDPCLVEAGAGREQRHVAGAATRRPVAEGAALPRNCVTPSVNVGRIEIPSAVSMLVVSSTAPCTST